MKIQAMSPVLVVDQNEPAVSLWTEKLGYEKVTEVPHGGAIGFVVFARDGREVMLQTPVSVEEDVPAVAELGASTILYFNVESLANALACAW